VDLVLLMLLLAFLLPAGIHVATFLPFLRLLRKRGLVRRNYRKHPVPTAGGLFLMGSCTISLTVFGLLMEAAGISWLTLREGMVFLAGSLSMGMLGWQDDLAGDKEVKGLRGHLLTLFREQRMTGGLMKLLGGGATALICSLCLSGTWEEVVIHAGILALYSNLVNLFDLRPGRALKVFWLLLALLMAGTPLSQDETGWVYLTVILVATALYFVYDARGIVMLGDTGANYLGFLLGFANVLWLPDSAKVVVLGGLIAIHILAEFISFSRIIQSVPLLALVDRWGRK
jgi:UDP-GlcNAc:undecaprenyl-phosphate GlcNAc-1-phosphate transferase